MNLSLVNNLTKEVNFVISKVLKYCILIIEGFSMETKGFKERGSGVLMHISSLPGPYGIGTLGESAYKFVDFLVLIFEFLINLLWL